MVSVAGAIFGVNVTESSELAVWKGLTNGGKNWECMGLSGWYVVLDASQLIGSWSSE